MNGQLRGLGNITQETRADILVEVLWPPMDMVTHDQEPELQIPNNFNLGHSSSISCNSSLAHGFTNRFIPHRTRPFQRIIFLCFVGATPPHSF